MGNAMTIKLSGKAKGQITLMHLLTIFCFTSIPFIGILSAGKEAGGVGILIGMGVGLGAGGLAYYAVRWIYFFEFESRTWFKSLPQGVKYLIDEGMFWFILSLIFGAGLMTLFFTKFVVQQMAG